ncbi:hypothetical protein LTR53_018366, partial [Teratosphaeriaceae sp. CCFEE 6253]
EGTSKESSAEPRVKEETPDEADTCLTAAAASAAEVGTVGPAATEPSQQGSALVEAAAED